ncbi:MAG TPA: leucyl/phenylalanyl-tRNA--protein transferase [Sphingobacteriaceae bacterium]
MIYQLDDEDIWFPSPANAEQDGLLAVGGDLSSERLMLAYHWGIFPWYSDETPILWYSPHERFVIFPERIRVSKSMRQVLRKGIFTITFNEAFEEVIGACATSERADQNGTWITDDMQQAYVRLHKLGFAHSVEVWSGNALVGGLYGVAVGKVFCGESMFSRMSNASKAALIWLCTGKRFEMIDCQFHTAHLESLGAEFISREEYLAILQRD